MRQTCEHYAKGRDEAKGRFVRYVYDDPISKIVLHKLTDRHVRDWRKRLEATPARVSRTKGLPQLTRPCSPATVNRDMVVLRAVLNLALHQRDVLSARAWRKALEPAEAQGRRHLYLDRDQRRTLLAALPDDAAAFARGLCLLPLRPGAMTGLLVRDFNAGTQSLTIQQDKAGKARTILLPDDIASLIKKQADEKAPTLPLFARADGMAWNKDSWKIPIKSAVRASGGYSGS